MEHTGMVSKYPAACKSERNCRTMCLVYDQLWNVQQLWKDFRSSEAIYTAPPAVLPAGRISNLRELQILCPRTALGLPETIGRTVATRKPRISCDIFSFADGEGG
jgi:hypothetical protein